ncbi:MAG: cob(I)yrinic acid a,c-diamide adenosyltransferase [Desulfoprunum sp.]|jgi:cob(I)alamin adenosyltransferase|uniref:cob(I)yrinic acid a,c-diamide adenosyltransferase n=1 Tax=Desulfoprunum sp. TaxID=2020866 RepID=UPI0026C756DE
MTRGLLAVFTGNGKGKTTSALGLAFRALGHGHKVSVIQFIKGNWTSGEHLFAKNISPLIEFHVMGKGFTWKSENLAEDTALARKGWELAVETIDGNRHHLVILDELTYLIRYNMVAEEEVLQVLQRRPPEMHVVVTGRHASDRLIEMADLVTEMIEIKHPYANGIAAQKGFEF